MAESSISVDQDQFSCSICLDLLKDPVAIPCGHSYCMCCIKDCWDLEDHVGVYSCPQCRQTFSPRPVLGRNTMLADVVEKIKKTSIHEAPLLYNNAKTSDVTCDVCTGTKVKAVKSCLVCLASYCVNHLQPHYESPVFQKHKMIEATGKLQDKICSKHDKLLEVYCRTDQQCICYLCVMGEHRGHNTLSAAAERAEKLKHAERKRQEFKLRICDTQRKIEELKKAMDTFTCSAQAAVEDCDKIFTDLVQSMEIRRYEVIKLIRDQEKAAVSQAQDALDLLQVEICTLKNGDAELEQLSHMEDDIDFLQRWPTDLCESGILHRISVKSHHSFGETTKIISKLKEQLDDMWKKTSVNISETVKQVHIVQTMKPTPLRQVSGLRQSEPRTRAEFLQYACQLTLDPNTANEHLCLSEGNRVVTWQKEPQPYHDHSERFNWHQQVLCKESLSGRSYWEIEWRGNVVGIAVTYKRINRKGVGNDCCLGFNSISCSLYCSLSGYSYMHNNERTAVNGPRSTRIGVYLDHEAGTLSFYSVSNTMTLLHRVQTTFTEPVYPGFWFPRLSMLWSETKLKLCQIE